MTKIRMFGLALDHFKALLVKHLLGFNTLRVRLEYWLKHFNKFLVLINRNKNAMSDIGFLSAFYFLFLLAVTILAEKYLHLFSTYIITIKNVDHCELFLISLMFRFTNEQNFVDYITHIYLIHFLRSGSHLKVHSVERTNPGESFLQFVRK